MSQSTGKTKKERLLSALSVISIILTFALLLVLLVFAMYKMGVISLPDFVLDLFGINKNGNSDIQPGDDSRIYNSLIENMSKGNLENIEYDINAIDAYAAITESAALSRYSAEFSVSHYSENSERTQNISVIKDKDKYRIEVYEGQTLVKTLVCDGEQICFTDHITYKVSTAQYYSNGGIFTFESEALVPSLADAFDKTKTENLVVSLSKYEDRTVYMLEYDIKGTDCREILFVSLEFGLVIGAETYLRGEHSETLLYRLVTNSVTSTVNSDENTFTVQ